MRLERKPKAFRWSPFSPKQLLASIWWLHPKYKHLDGIIADGSRRSGKTIVLAVAFVKWAFTYFENQDFIMAGKTVGSFNRNVYNGMKSALMSQGYIFDYKRSDGYFIIRDKNGKQNYFYVFGGKDVSSAGIVQGTTAAGAFLDEAVLMPEEFIAMCLSSCSVEGSKYWMTCNPDNPNHYFKKEFIDKAEDKRLLYLHFTMDDNLSLAPEVKERYKRQFTGVFFKRYILGLWVIAEGLIYEVFANNKSKYSITKEEAINKVRYITFGIDFGGSKSATAFTATGYDAYFGNVYVLKSERRIDSEGKPIKDNPDSLSNAWIQFYNKVKLDYKKSNIASVRADSAEQVLINGLQMRMTRDDVRMIVSNAIKKPINERIQMMIELLSDNRIWFVEGETYSVQEAIETAMWDNNPLSDERLDDGSSDIDSMDSLEYSYEEWMDELQSYIVRG